MHTSLADEINRTPPKTQAALLQAMQEHAVTVGGDTMALGAPFCAGNARPIEQEGTYSLPEAQLDRFIFELLIDYPQAEEEEEIARSTTSGRAPKCTACWEQSSWLQHSNWCVACRWPIT